MIADLAGPYRRPQQRWAAERRVARGLLAALVVAVALLVLLGTVAYGGTSGGGPERVTVRQGDTLWSIAAAHYAGDTRAGVWKIEHRNRIVDDVIVPGERLVLPP